MNCLPCFQKDEDDDDGSDKQPATREAPCDVTKESIAASSNAQTFTFRELAMATKNFRQECLLGEGGFGRVFKGKLHSNGQVVAVKQLDRNGMHGNKEFLVEIMMLSLHQHQNLVNLIGYCADGDQRLLVYEYMPMGNLETHLFGDDPDKKPMDWCTRMKVAAGAAQGLEYLHDKANPPVIYRDLKPSNILLDESYEPKLSDFGLAKLGAGGGGKMHATSRVMGTYGYSAPEYSSSGELTLKSDIYSFGVVLLELITGRKVIDTTRPNDEQNLVTWAQPIFREPKRFPDLADPNMNNEFPVTSLNQAVGICAMCLQEEASVRPLIGDVVAALSFLAMPQATPTYASVQAQQNASKGGASNASTPPQEQKMHYKNDANQDQASESDRNSSNNDDGSSEGSEDEYSDEGSDSEQQNEESSQHAVGDGGESHSEHADYSEVESAFSDSDSAGEDNNLGDSATELELSGRSLDASLFSINSASSSTSDVGNLSSKYGSSRKSSPTKRTSSRSRKAVVTFKEPTLSTKKNGSKRAGKEVNSSHNQPVASDTRQQSSSSSSSSDSSSSEPEDEKGSPGHQSAVAQSQEDRPSGHRKQVQGGEATSKADANENHRVFDETHKEVPKLRHIMTR